MTAPLSRKVSKEAMELATGLWLHRNVVTEKINILGQSGGGKTYLATKLAELMLQVSAQIVVIDLVGVWWGLRSSADGKSPGFPVLVIGGDHGDLPLNAKAGAVVADLVVERRISVVLDVSDLDEDEMGVFVADFLQRLFKRKKTQPSPLHLFFEEAQELFPEQLSSKEEVRLRKVGTRICKIGRNRGIGYTTVSQEPQAVSKRILNQAGTVIAVRTIGSQEREAVAKTARSRTRSKADLNLIEVLPELETGQAIVFSPAWLKFIGQVSILPKTTFDSSKTPEVGAEPPEPEVLAPVEIEQLRQAMADEIAAVESTNVDALKRRLKQLEVQLASVPPPAAPIEVPAITDDDRALIRLLGNQLEASRVVLAKLDEQLGLAPMGHRGAGVTTKMTVPASWAAAIAATPKTVVRAPAPLVEPAEIDARDADTRLLRVLLAHGPVSEATLAVFSGMSAAGGGFRKAVKRLRDEQQFVEECEGVLSLTAEGRARAKAAAAGTAYDRAPIVELWKAKLGAPWELLAALASGPKSEEKLAAAVGMSAKGGGFRKNLKKLRTSGLVVEGAEVALTEPMRQLLDGYAGAGAARSHADIADGWRAKLADGPRALFDSLLKNHPAHLTTEELAERVGMVASGGGFRKNLKKLRTLGLVVETDTGVSASPALWP